MTLSSPSKVNGIPAPWQEVTHILPPGIRRLITDLSLEAKERLEEIRLRTGRPAAVTLTGEELFVARCGGLTSKYHEAHLVTSDDMERTIQSISRSSIYALEEELKKGFITLHGGHRVGLTGRAVLENGRIKTIKHISCLNIRISREIPGIANRLLPYIAYPGRGICHTIIFSPPGCGKTTLLRDIIRQISSGRPELGIPGVTVGVVDERSELAGCHRGIPQRDVGPRTDVMDGCPKDEGMLILLRSMSPRVIATDEIGRIEDIKALEEVFNAGVKVMATVHGATLEELSQRPALRYLLNLRVIERFVLLGRSGGTGTIEDIVDGKSMKSMGVKLC